MHKSDCAVHNEPAYPSGPCDCGARKATCLEYAQLKQEIAAIEKSVSDKVFMQNVQMDIAKKPFEEIIEKIKAADAPLLKERKFRLSVLDSTIKKELAEQVELEDGTKVNVQVRFQLHKIKKHGLMATFTHGILFNPPHEE